MISSEDTKTYDLSIFDTLSSSDDEETKKLKEKQEKVPFCLFLFESILDRLTLATSIHYLYNKVSVSRRIAGVC